MPSNRYTHFNIDTAQEMAETFAVSTGVPCSLYSPGGERIYAAGNPQECCRVCMELTRVSGVNLSCEDIHKKAIDRSEQFGGRYIYICPASMMFSASPIIYEGNVAGALIAGPVLNLEAKEFLENDIRAAHITDQAIWNCMREKISVVPFVEPHRMNDISRQLFANAVFISDTGRELILSQNRDMQQNSIGEYICQLKSGEEIPAYPMNTEWELTMAISHGNRQEAARLLNEILGYIFFSTGGNRSAMQTRIIELLVVLSRAAISGGANPETVLYATEKYMKELSRLGRFEDLAPWLADSLNHFTSLVFDIEANKHKNAISCAVDYVRKNYARPITVNEVADYVGYSHSYFSNLFKKEMECGFRTYLNRVRIEKSKILLLSGKFTVPEICEITGFPDQSTFGKVFKQETGVTPGRFRKANRRIDIDKEHGNL